MKQDLTVERFRLKFSLTMLLGGAFFVLLALIVGSLYVNHLQKQNVVEALELAREQARQLAVDVLDSMEANRNVQTSQQELARKVSGLTEIVVRQNRDIIWAGVFDEHGRHIIEDSSDGSNENRFTVLTEGQAYKQKLGGGHDSNMEIEVKTGDPSFREIKQPVSRDGKILGEVVLRVNQSPKFSRILTSSRQITKVLLLETLVLLVALLGLSLLSWKIFKRQMTLIKRNAQLDRLAYVGTMASGLAHEIRNPLGAISLNIQLVNEALGRMSEESESERAGSLVSVVEKEVGHLNETLTQFLDFALPRKDAIVEFSLKELFSELLALQAPAMERAGITWKLNVPKNDELLFKGDRGLLHQAMLNIIVNAIQMMDDALRRNLDVMIVAQGNQYRIAVRDTGPGIPPDDIERIFDVFVSRRRGGSGLGLPTAKRIVEDHGGEIWAENSDDGPGAIIKVVLQKKGYRLEK